MLSYNPGMPESSRCKGPSVSDCGGDILYSCLLLPGTDQNVYCNPFCAVCGISKELLQDSGMRWQGPGVSEM
jgi:hypothetical protein